MVNKLPAVYECPFDNQLFTFIDMHLSLYYNLGFSPNVVTTFSIIFGVFAAHQIAIGRYNIAALLMLISYYFDCVDGKLARQYNMVTSFGDLYDHTGDIIKIILILYALFAINQKTSKKQWLYIALFSLLALIQCIHLGYQEAVYNKTEESSYLNMWRNLIHSDQTPEKTIQWTRYFGCGTWYLCFALLIIFWRK